MPPKQRIRCLYGRWEELLTAEQVAVLLAAALNRGLCVCIYIHMYPSLLIIRSLLITECTALQIRGLVWVVRFTREAA